MYCEKCGAFNDDDAVFCTECGGKIGAAMPGKPKSGGSNKIVIIAVIAVFVVLLAVVSIIFIKRGKEDKQIASTSVEKYEESEIDENTDEYEIPEIEESNDYEIEEKEEEKTLAAVNMNYITDVTASSILIEKSRTHYADRIMDGDLTAAWTEGAEGHGIGESVTIYFNDTYKISGFYIHAGYHKTEKLYWENARPRSLEISCNGKSYGEYSLRDYMGEQEVILSKPIEADQITLTITDVFEGSKYEDAVISELYLY